MRGWIYRNTVEVRTPLLAERGAWHCRAARPRCIHRGLNGSDMIGVMANTLAIMLTMTTYGTWLRGDERGWVDDGRILPANPILKDDDRKRMKHSVYLFERSRLLDVGEFIGKSLCERLNLRILALTVQTWHVHLLFGTTVHAIADIAKCAKDSVRWGIRPKRPIWSDGYDKRYCFDESSVWNRMRYVERHNVEQDWPAKPWPFVETPSFSPR